MQIENVPSAENPKTGRLTPLSVVAALRKLASPLAIGT
jgi:aspartate dehydrogenase